MGQIQGYNERLLPFLFLLIFVLKLKFLMSWYENFVDVLDLHRKMTNLDVIRVVQVRSNRKENE